MTVSLVVGFAISADAGSGRKEELAKENDIDRKEQLVTLVEWLRGNGAVFNKVLSILCSPYLWHLSCHVLFGCFLSLCEYDNEVDIILSY